MPEECCFPDCPGIPSRRDDGTLACSVHQTVHVATSGSWVNDHHTDGGHG